MSVKRKITKIVFSGLGIDDPTGKHSTGVRMLQGDLLVGCSYCAQGVEFPRPDGRRRIVSWAKIEWVEDEVVSKAE